jgi:hypothetical protein
MQVNLLTFRLIYSLLLAFTGLLAMTWRNGWRRVRASEGAVAPGKARPRACVLCMAAWNCAMQQKLLSAPTLGQLDGNRHGDTDAAFPRGKPSSDQRCAAQHLGDGALPRCRDHERAGAARISPGRYERRGLDDASRGLGFAFRSSLPKSRNDSEMAPQPIGIARNGLGNGRASW